MNKPATHLAVIMARGESRRMGAPKGLCRLSSAHQPFALQICQQYLQLGFAVLIVVHGDDEAEYVRCLRGVPVSILAAKSGGDTAQTMKLSLDWSARQPMEVTCFWAHPIDMPLVQVQTLKLLKSVFVNDSPGGLRPVFVEQSNCPDQPGPAKRPGHPVLFQSGELEKVLVGKFEHLTMAQAWKVAMSQGVVDVVQEYSTNDPGVVTDFDTPEQIIKFQNSKES